MNDTAERMRRYRERQKDGRQVVPVEVDQEMVEMLLANRVLKREDCGDPNAIGRAISALAKAPRRYA